MSEMPDAPVVLVLTEIEGSRAGSITYELLGIGKKIASDLKGIVGAVVLGHQNSEVVEEVGRFSDAVYSVDHPELATFKGELYVSVMLQLCRKVNPDIVIIGSTLNGLDLGPRLAYKLEVDIVTDCVQLAVVPQTGHLLCTKPVYGANINSVFKLEKKPCMAILRPKSVEPIMVQGTLAELLEFDANIENSLTKVETIERVKEEGVDLKKAELIVAGGRGIRNAEGIETLKGLVHALRKHSSNVEFGASRPLVDAHLVPSSLQIGLTGEKVAPKLYIAVGISGSLQHMAGVLGAKKIIAINNDPEAYIFKAADYGVVGRFEEIVPALKEKLEEL